MNPPSHLSPGSDEPHSALRAPRFSASPGLSKSLHRLLRELPRKAFNSRFFTISALLHFILVLVLGGTVLVAPRMADDFAATPQADFEPGSGGVDVIEEPHRAPENTARLDTDKAVPEIQVLGSSGAGSNLQAIDLIHSERAVMPPDFSSGLPSTPGALPVAPGSLSGSPVMHTPGSAGFSREQLQKMRDFNDHRVKGPSGTAQEGKYRFTICLAKYGDPNDPQRAGDWASTHRLKEGKIVGGSLPNLAFMMTAFSKGRMNAEFDPEPIDLASDTLFSRRPPFVFFTGHRDFVLTEREVENLRKYVMLGGCVWGDSSLPGRRSRFDIAFRREMRRVIPEVVHEWEVVRQDHPMFTRDLLFREVKAHPAGMNFYQEPVYALRLYGEIAVLYTANDYADLWQIGIDGRGRSTSAAMRREPMWRWRSGSGIGAIFTSATWRNGRCWSRTSSGQTSSPIS